jgi:hypothetical protein
MAKPENDRIGEMTRHLKRGTVRQIKEAMMEKQIRVTPLAKALGPAGALILVFIAAAFGSLVIQLESLSIASYSISSNGVTIGTAGFSGGASSVEPLAVTSNNPAVASVPTSVPLIPPNDRVTFPVRGVSAGCATIIAAHRGRSRERRIVVHPANSGATFSLTVPDQIVILGGQSPGRVTTSMYGTALVALSSSNPAVASVPSRVETARRSAAFGISGLHEGCAIISATIRGQPTVSKTVQVVYIGG